VEAPFDIQAFLDHDAVSYLTQPIVVNTLWRALAGGPRARALGRSLGAFDRVTRRVGRVTRRALLVGINDYPNPADRLEGCVNDVFLMSSVLQECGFSAEDIRVVLDDRATAKGVLERLGWLLEGVGPGDERVFYYSGHGAQIPNYGPALETDHYDECLVTHDFAWTTDTGLTDDRFYDLYSQLPYEARFVAIFDCCHSGGMTRDGGARVRGLNPPDDIRHRELRWDPSMKCGSGGSSVPRPDLGTRSRCARISGEPVRRESSAGPCRFGGWGAGTTTGRAGISGISAPTFP
jgi:hypothetical protein